MREGKDKKKEEANHQIKTTVMIQTAKTARKIETRATKRVVIVIVIVTVEVVVAEKVKTEEKKIVTVTERNKIRTEREAEAGTKVRIVIKENTKIDQINRIIR